MKRFFKLYKWAKAYGAKRPLWLANKCWWRGDDWYSLLTINNSKEFDYLGFTIRNDISVFHVQCNRCGCIFDDRYRTYYPCPEHPLV